MNQEKIKQVTKIKNPNVLQLVRKATRNECTKNEERDT